MSDAVRLPARPHLEQYKKLAKDFVDACRAGTLEAVRAWAAAWLDRLEGSEPEDADRILRVWQRLASTRPALARCRLADAQFLIARVHEFASWPVFAAHVEALSRERSGTALFESAVDAIVAGDAGTLRRLLGAHPELVHARSAREHHATLLHYVSANGVEDFRQKTPPNIVEVARLLLDAGADVNAGSQSYGTNDTTFLLTATSVHPELAGVQDELLELLLARGATIDDGGASTVRACLHNGRGRAAKFCADRGASLDLEGGAGVGRLDVVQRFVAPDGTLRGGTTRTQIVDGFAWACEYGHAPVVEYLLNAGVPIDGPLRHDGQTALHWGAYGGHADVVRLLLDRGAPVNQRDRSYDGTPLEWALYAWGNRDVADRERESYYGVAALLARAGATISPAWFSEDDKERSRAAERLRHDARMQAALTRT